MFAPSDHRGYRAPLRRIGGRIPALWLVAAGVVLLEAVSAIAGLHAVTLSAAALFAPGLALTGLLPQPVRAHRLATLAAAPLIGFAAVTAALITASRVGVPLTGLSVRCVLAAVVLVAVVTWPAAADPEDDAERAPLDLLELAGLLVVLAVGVVLSLRVVGGTPVPGNDWAKYLLYADEIRKHGALGITNPYWMLGVPFREDPAIPAGYGSALIMARVPAAALVHGILIFAALQTLGVYAYVRAYWGRAAGVLAAALVTVVPASQDILGWHGLPNLAALGLLTLLLAYLGRLCSEQLTWRETTGLAVTLIGLAATHRLTATIAVAVVGLSLLSALVTGRRSALVDLARAAGLGLLLGLGVVADLYARQKTFGGSLPYTAYLGTKLNLTLAVRDLSPFLTGAAALGLLGLAVTRRLDRALWPAVALIAVCAALSYAWVVHIPMYYARMVYFVPAAAACVAAVALTRLRPGLLVAAVAAVGLTFIIHTSYRQAREVEAFYTYTTPTTLRGLDAVSAQLRPGEVVVTDRCWSFLAAWLLHTRTLSALEPQDIQPKAELQLAEQAHAILDATPVGRRRARQLGVRFLVVNPNCPSPTGAPLPPPPLGKPVFASDGLAILELGH